MTTSAPRTTDAAKPNHPDSSKKTAQAMWDNRSAPGGATNTLRGLTHSLDLSKEGLAMKATRINVSGLDSYDTAAIARILAKCTESPNGCWVWSGGMDLRGYGRVKYRGSLRSTHRITYELLVGAIPEGLVIDHLCNVPSCVNPEHLEAVTQRENVMRSGNFTARHARATHCPKMHPYDEVNTYVTPEGFRGCRVCRNANSRRWKAAKHARGTA